MGFLYQSVAEDYFTGFTLHCKGWTSVYCSPSRPQFMGTSTTNLNDLLIQGTRWSSGLAEVGFSRFCPLIYGSLRMPILQSMCYAELAFLPLYCLPICIFATIPQICLLNGIAIYPKVINLTLLSPRLVQCQKSLVLFLFRITHNVVDLCALQFVDGGFSCGVE